MVTKKNMTELEPQGFSNLWLHTLCIFFLIYGYISTIILIRGILPKGSVNFQYLI